MKKVFIVLSLSSLALLTASFAHALTGPVECAKKAMGQPLGLTVGQAQNLCVGATSDAPARCLEKASGKISYPNSLSQGMELCIGATSTEPYDCLKQAESELGLSVNFDLQTIVSLCRPRALRQ